MRNVELERSLNQVNSLRVQLVNLLDQVLYGTPGQVVSLTPKTLAVLDDLRDAVESLAAVASEVEAE